MTTSTIKQLSAQPLILVPVEVNAIEQHANSAEEAYFAGLLDTGDEPAAPTAALPAPITPVPAAPTLAAYLVGLLDDGHE